MHIAIISLSRRRDRLLRQLYAGEGGEDIACALGSRARVRCIVILCP
jgi:hypothetical protein